MVNRLVTGLDVVQEWEVKVSADVAIVTGAAGAIGAAAAKRLASRGVAVGLLDLEAEQCHATVEEIVAAGGSATATILDTTDPDSVEAALDWVETELGPVSFAVTAAGIIKKEAYLDLTPEAWARTIGVNLTGTWLVMQRVARRMIAGSREGAFVALSSVAGRSGRSTAVDYAASKAGVISLVVSTAQALAKHNIRANAVCPGVVDTPMTDAIHEQTAAELGITEEESLARFVAAIPLGRVVSADEVAAVIDFLLTDEAAYITGQALNVCGGLEFN